MNGFQGTFVQIEVLPEKEVSWTAETVSCAQSSFIGSRPCIKKSLTTWVFIYVCVMTIISHMHAFLHSFMGVLFLPASFNYLTQAFMTLDRITSPTTQIQKLSQGRKWNATTTGTPQTAVKLFDSCSAHGWPQPSKMAKMPIKCVCHTVVLLFYVSLKPVHVTKA